MSVVTSIIHLHVRMFPLNVAYEFIDKPAGLSLQLLYYINR